MRAEFILIFLLGTYDFCLANDQDVKLDSIIAISNDIRAQVKKKSPIAAYKYGIEINPVIWIFGANDGLAFTGGVQFFNWDREAEVSFPFQIFNDGNQNFFSLDAHYRKFLGETQYGFYLSGFLRSAYLNDNHSNFSSQPTSFSDSRFGLGAGLGYRIYSSKHLYWGFSLNLGKYLIYKEDPIYSSLTWGGSTNTSIILDMEFFKFGYAF